MRTVAELGFGVLFAIGALFNAAYTLTHTDEFFGSFSEGAWFRPGRWLIDEVVLPNAIVITVLIVLFEATLAVLIFTRGDLVRPALFAGGTFAFAAALVSNPGGTAANAVLAAALFWLAVIR